MSSNAEVIEVGSGEDAVLAGRVTLVAGGAGNVGRVIVRSMLERGATVVVPSRSPERLEALRRELGPELSRRLVTLDGDLSDSVDGPRLVGEIGARVGPLDAAVSSLGRFVAAPSVLEAPIGDLEAVIDGYLTAHFAVARAVLPLLEETGGSYTFINGPLAFEPRFPGTGLVSIVTAAQAMLARVVMNETAGRKVRVNEVVLYTMFGWDEADDAGDGVRPEEVGRYVALLASKRGAEVRGRTIHLDSREVVAEMAG